METILKKPYEISLWGEHLYWVRKELKQIELTESEYEPGKYYSQNQEVLGAIPYTLDYEGFKIGRLYYKIKEDGLELGGNSADSINITEENGEEWNNIPNTVLQYYKEQKICIIGSNTMEAPIRAVQPKFTSNVNGSHTLTFVMYSHYRDDNNNLQINPFLRYLTNERKVKLKYDEKWYDFVIKNIAEDSVTKAFTYTCKDLFINELSKSGFELVFDNELENNMGSINKLAGRILEGSDWKYEDSDLVVKQYLEEPLYKATIKSEITATKMYDMEEKVDIPIDKVIYIFYSSVANKTNTIQFLYDPAQIYQMDDANIIIGYTQDTPKGAYNYSLSGIKWNDDDTTNFTDLVVFAPTIRGKKIIKSQKTVYDAKIDKLVGVFKDADDNDIYGFKDTEYISPAAVRNYVTSGDCSSISGWRYAKSAEDEGLPTRKVITYPEFNESNIQSWDGDNYIEFTPAEGKEQYLINTGISDNDKFIGSFEVGQEYWLRGNFYSDKGETSFDPTNQIQIAQYKFDDTAINSEDITPIFEQGEQIKEENEEEGENPTSKYNFSYKFRCIKSISETELKNGKYGIIITSNKTFYVKNLEFFKYETFKKEDKTEVVLTPDMSVFESYVKDVYKYYDSNSEYTSLEDLIILESSNSPSEIYVPYYGNGEEAYEKIRSITAKESNRFNLLQSLCELFECWCRFNIEHEPNGTISLDENYRQKKSVSFHEYIGKNNYAGFRYGVNLKSIKRTLDSEGAISKIIVKQNANEFAPHGYCTIQRAEENPTGESFIYNFDYYIGQRLLNFSTISNDLYGSSAGGYLGYYNALKKLNVEMQVLAEKLENKNGEIANIESVLQFNTSNYDQSIQQKIDKETELLLLTGFTLQNIFTPVGDEELEKRRTNWLARDEVKKILQSIAMQTATSNQAETIIKSQKELFSEAQEEHEKIENRLQEIRKQKIAINKTFYQKYSRFIQEGSWISEDYIDDNLYYLDALSTLYTSSRPQVNYTIDVVELSCLPGYENIKFEVGDKTFVQDEEFFGWAYDGSKRLYREEVIIAETIFELDSPENNKIKVQNYKTQFEDLFQRVVATTQQVQFSTGEYQRSAAIVQPDGTLLASTLQNSFINNAITLQNSRDQSVLIDENGITTTNLSYPSEMLRLVAGGIFLSKDGGTNWTTGISANGINANAITTGQLNAAEVNITMGTEIAFRWDLLGITAYKRDQYGIDQGTFTRFDQFGLYGLQNHPNFIALEEGETRETALQKIKKEAHFGLTWDEFWLKANGANGYTSISSDKDFQVVKTLKNDAGKVTEEISIIQIGRLGKINNSNSDYYGIRINNSEGAPVMETDDKGELWLKKRLRIGTNDTSTVEIGYLDAVRTETETGTKVHEVIHAGKGKQEFIVYEDGKMVAQGAEFHGAIYATGGEIGGIKIEQWTDMGYSVRIESTAGTILKNEGTILTAKLYKGTEEVTTELTYQWKKNGVLVGSTQSIEVLSSDLDNGDIAVYTCEIDFAAS